MSAVAYKAKCTRTNNIFLYLATIYNLFWSHYFSTHQVLHTRSKGFHHDGLQFRFC